jgi:hypothetical protein
MKEELTPEEYEAVLDEINEFFNPEDLPFPSSLMKNFVIRWQKSEGNIDDIILFLKKNKNTRDKLRNDEYFNKKYESHERIFFWQYSLKNKCEKFPIFEKILKDILENEEDLLAEDILDKMQREYIYEELMLIPMEHRKFLRDIEHDDIFMKAPLSLLGKILSKCWDMIVKYPSQEDNKWVIRDFVKINYGDNGKFSLNEFLDAIPDERVRVDIEKYLLEYKNSTSEWENRYRNQMKHENDKIPFGEGKNDKELAEYILNIFEKKCSEYYELRRILDFFFYNSSRHCYYYDHFYTNDILEYEYEINSINRIKPCLRGRDDLIDRVFAIKGNDNYKLIFFIFIGTKKAFFPAIKISEQINNMEIILDEYKEHLIIKYIRKEITNPNNALCISILRSDNENIVKFAFAKLLQCQNRATIFENYKFSKELSEEYTKFCHIMNLNYRRINLYKFYICNILLSKDEKKICDDEFVKKEYSIDYTNYANCSDEDYNGFCFISDFTYNPPKICGILLTINGYIYRSVIDIYELLSKNNEFAKKMWVIIKPLFEYIPLYGNDSKEKRFVLGQNFLYSIIYECLYNNKLSANILRKWNRINIEYKNLIVPYILLNANNPFPNFGSDSINDSMIGYISELFCPKKNFYKFNNELREKGYDYYHKDICKYYWCEVILKEQLEIYNEQPIKHSTSPSPVIIESEYKDYILSRSDDIFASGIDTLMVHEFKEVLLEERKKNIKALKTENLLNEEEERKLLELVSSANYYGLSNEEIKNCLTEEKDEEWWKIIPTRLESEFMGHIFEKCLLWMIKFDKSELLASAPWQGVKIFSNSFTDRPMVWAKHLFRILNEKLEEMEFIQVCFALGNLREPLGGIVPKELKRIADNEQNPKIKELILRQYKRFNRGNLEKGKYVGNEKKRIEKCREKLLEISERRFNPK